MARRHGLRVDPAWVSPTPGIVSGLGLILQAVSAPGDEVVVFPPAYHAFRRIILANERRILDAQLVETATAATPWISMRCARKLTPRTKVVFFCSPHNPGGTVWSADEIRALADLLRRARPDPGVRRDPLRSRLRGARHTPTIAAAPEIADRLITCVAATKTFNLAGAHVGACFTSNAGAEAPPRRADHGERPRLLQQLRHDRDRGGVADRRGLARRAAALSRRNRDLFDARIEAAAPGARSMRLDATYLAWVDFSATGLPPEEVAARVKNRARIFASPGPQFGPGGETWLRFNFATPRPILEEALGRLEDAFADLRAGR